MDKSKELFNHVLSEVNQYVNQLNKSKDKSKKESGIDKRTLFNDETTKLINKVRDIVGIDAFYNGVTKDKQHRTLEVALIENKYLLYIEFVIIDINNKSYFIETNVVLKNADIVKVGFYDYMDRFDEKENSRLPNGLRNKVEHMTGKKLK